MQGNSSYYRKKAKVEISTGFFWRHMRLQTFRSCIQVLFKTLHATLSPLALARAGISQDDVKIFEVNEAFAAVIKANAQVRALQSPLFSLVFKDICINIKASTNNSRQILDIPIEKINPRGGAIALGHALGSSGSRIITTLLHQLKPGEYGCAAICNGGGGASAIVVERVA